MSSYFIPGGDAVPSTTYYSLEWSHWSILDILQDFEGRALKNAEPLKTKETKTRTTLKSARSVEEVPLYSKIDEVK